MNMSVLTLQEYEFEKQFNENEAIQWMQENCSRRMMDSSQLQSCIDTGHSSPKSQASELHRDQSFLLCTSVSTWREKNHRKKSFLFSALYAAFIFGGRHLMNKRAKFELRKPLVLWSLSLAVFSIFGAVRTGAYMLYILMTKGLKQSVCDQSFYNGPVSKFWAYAFVLSKAPELGDTIFIILRKQKLIFLHWYHHITVLLYSWYSYKDMVAGGGWFMTMNYGVHAVMYSYYALRAAGFRVSRKFAMFITLSQITQMLIGCVVNYLVFSWMQQGQCHSHVQNIIWSSLMYLSYFVLFCHFFFEAYIGKTRKTRKAD
ncbi:very long chain fatty acid elongase 6 isoform X1 [Apteryx mantelli]|uniref:Elongation of very long chain fatty acids protein 6 n=4 Tax=Palaeognathae TaxID=8783 RepID=A0ABM4ELY4_9AVES